MTHQIITVTPIFSIDENFAYTAESILNNMKPGDLWLIIIDSSSGLTKADFNDLVPVDTQVIIIKSEFEKYAGNTRNYGLRYIESNRTKPYILTFFDSDDKMYSNYFELLREHFKSNRGLVSFSYDRIEVNRKVRVKHTAGFVRYPEFLKNYNTSCVTSSVLIEADTEICTFSFGRRRRANDQLFFLSVCEYFGGVYYRSEVVAEYRANNINSLSAVKTRMPVYKYLALRDHGLSKTTSIRLLFLYVFNGILRHWLK